MKNINNWYALFVTSGQENKVKKTFEMIFGEEFKCIVPKRELRERKDGKWNIVKGNYFLAMY